MKCPVCKSALYEYDIKTIKFDICRDGCSGMWFDEAEFEKCDQQAEAFPDELLRIRKSPNVLIDRSKIRQCPKCPDTDLKRVILDQETRFEIDHCPTCKGQWLDLGELEHLRAEDREVVERQARMDAYENKVNEQINDADLAFRVKSFIAKLVG